MSPWHLILIGYAAGVLTIAALWAVPRLVRWAWWRWWVLARIPRDCPPLDFPQLKLPALRIPPLPAFPTLGSGSGGAAENTEREVVEVGATRSEWDPSPGEILKAPYGLPAELQTYDDPGDAADRPRCAACAKWRPHKGGRTGWCRVNESCTAGLGFEDCGFHQREPADELPQWDGFVVRCDEPDLYAEGGDDG